MGKEAAHWVTGDKPHPARARKAASHEAVWDIPTIAQPSVAGPVGLWKLDLWGGWLTGVEVRGGAVFVDYS